MDERIKKVMAAVFGIETAQINDGLSPDNLEKWDSLTHMTLVVALEEEFEVKFSEEEILEMMNYALVKEIIREKIKQS